MRIVAACQLRVLKPGPLRYTTEERLSVSPLGARSAWGGASQEFKYGGGRDFFGSYEHAHQVTMSRLNHNTFAVRFITVLKLAPVTISRLAPVTIPSNYFWVGSRLGN